MLYHIRRIGLKWGKDGAGKSDRKSSFDIEKYLSTAGVARKIVEYKKGSKIFLQGDRCDSVLFVQKGIVKLTILSNRGKEAVIALLSAGDFLGEGCIAGQPQRVATAIAMEPTSLLVIGKKEMNRVLNEEPQFSQRICGSHA